jgi:hypothetical protein
VRAFVTNRWLTPTLSVPLVENLEQMRSAKGRVAVVALASTVAGEAEARFMVNAVSMARQAGSERDPVVAIELSKRILVVRTRDGRVTIPAPVDYVVWTDRVKAFAAQGAKGPPRRIAVTGIASPRAREGLQATGWTLDEHSKR